MSNSIIRKVIILGAISIIGVLAIQAYWVMRTWDMKEQEFHRTIQIALRNVANELAGHKTNNSLPIHNLITQQASNYYVVNINDEIDANLLEYYLRKELERLSLNLDFEYGIFDCTSKEMVYGRFISTETGILDESPRQDELPSYDKFDYYFGVRFPSRTSHIMEGMTLTIIFSAILLFTIIFFIYSIFVILRQKKLSEMQKDFINNMTHEFKTPISTIKISADVFINNPVIQKDSRLSKYAAIIKEQNQRLNNQVEKVLQLAKIERQSFELNEERIDLHQLLLQTARSTEVKLESPAGKIQTALYATSPWVQADELHLTNIVHNLLDNAIKYCKSDPKITLTTEDYGPGIRFKIQDNGIGIAKEHQSSVFDKFYRVPTGNVHDVKGFGLGLYYIQNICEAHGWPIQLESEVEKGTTITILIKKWPERQTVSIPSVVTTS